MLKLIIKSLCQNKSLIFKFPLAFLLSIYYYPKFRYQKIWIVGGHGGDLYDDNGAIFHQYLLEKNEKVYFCLKKESKDYIKIKKIYTNSIIEKNSIKSIIIFIYSTYVIYSHSPGDVLNIFHYLFNNKIYVFLQHGITCFKRVTPEKRANLYVIATSREYNIFIKENVERKRLVKVGFPRFDKLIDTSKNLEKIILYMPTWRTWKEGNEILIEKINSLINNVKLINYLEKSGYSFHIYLHHAIQKYLNSLNSKNIKIIYPGEIMLQDELKKSQILVTDYSSVAWDFWYMKKKVLFYQFDQKEFLEKVGSYIEFDKNYHDIICKNEEELILKLLEEENREYSDSFYFKDTKNCERLYKKICNYNKKKER